MLPYFHFLQKYKEVEQTESMNFTTQSAKDVISDIVGGITLLKTAPPPSVEIILTALPVIVVVESNAHVLSETAFSKSAIRIQQNN